jgi:hypothetical protein
MAFRTNEQFDYGPIPMEIDNLLSTEKLAINKITIPKKIKMDVWNFYIGEELGVALCLCCSKEQIKSSHFYCKYVISKHNGGTMCIENLRPICNQCNLSIGKKNMNDYMHKCGYKYPPNWKCKLPKFY